MNRQRYSILTFREILDWPGGFIHDNFRTLVVSAAVITLIGAIPTILVTPLSLQQQDPSNFDLSTLPILYGGIFIGVMLGIVSWLATFRLVQQTREGGSPTIGSALSFAVHPSRFTTVFLVTIAAFFGWLACCLPGMAVVALFSFVPAAICARDVRFVDALSESLELATYLPAGRSIFESPFLRVLLLWLVFYGLNAGLTSFTSVPQFIFTMIQTSRTVASGEPPGAPTLPWMVVIMGGQLLAVVFQALANVYIASCLSIMYRNLRNMRLADDLLTAIEQRRQA